MSTATSTAPRIIKYEVNETWKAEVERLCAECKSAPGDTAAVARLRDYLRENNKTAIMVLS